MTARYFLLLLGTASFALGQEPDPKSPKPVPDVTVEALCVTLPTAQALPLIRLFRSAGPEPKRQALKEINALLDQGTAQLVGWPISTTRSRQKTVVEDIEEIRSATEFEASSTSIYLIDPKQQLIEDTAIENVAEQAPIATAFETRNAGVTLEAEPVVEDTTVALSFTLQHVRLKGVDRRITEQETVGVKKVRVVQEVPHFTTMRTSTSLSLESSERRLVGIFQLPDEKRTELFILGADVVR